MATKLSFVFVAAVILMVYTCSCLAADEPLCKYDDECASSGKSCCCSRFVGAPAACEADANACSSGFGSVYSCHPRPVCEYNNDCNMQNSTHDCCCSKTVGDPASFCGTANQCGGELSCTPKPCSTHRDCPGQDYFCCFDPDLRYATCETSCNAPKRYTCQGTTGCENNDGDCCCPEYDSDLLTCKPVSKCPGSHVSCIHQLG